MNALEEIPVWSRLGEFVRFAVTGGVSLVINLAIVVFLTEWVGLNYLVSMAVCFVTVTFISFWLNRVWTFRKAGGVPARDLGRYVFATGMQMALSLSTAAFCVQVLKIPYVITMVLLSVLLVPVTFLLHRGWSFSLPWRNRNT